MNPKQSRMARAGLGWRASDLAAAAGVGTATVARFELGETVAEKSIAAMRGALETAGAEFIDQNGRTGATVAD